MRTLLAMTLAAGFACTSPDGGGGPDRDVPRDASNDADGAPETADAGADADAEADYEAVSDAGHPGVQSFIWIANTAAGTLSKVDTIDAVETARYWTGPGGAGNDPSRTSVNLHGDMVVTNRNLGGVPGGASSATKFAADEDDCIDRNDNGSIETSTGPGDVLPWGEDECMLWHVGIAQPYGARATAWDGREDPETGEGGHVWIGTCSWGMGANYVFELDGGTGEVLRQATIPVHCAYGGAIDGRGGLWIIDNYAPDKVIRVDQETLAVTQHGVGLCGYGISVDSLGRVWTGGDVCINRYDPVAGTDQRVQVGAGCPGCTMLRGIAVGRERSGGFVWAADSSGNLVKVDEETAEVVDAYRIGTADMIGVAVDFQGYVWAVSQGGNEAYKFDPGDATFDTVPIGAGPYTYSDMTGMQLRQVILLK